MNIIQMMIFIEARRIIKQTIIFFFIKVISRINLDKIREILFDGFLLFSFICAYAWKVGKLTHFYFHVEEIEYLVASCHLLQTTCDFLLNAKKEREILSNLLTSILSSLMKLCMSQIIKQMSPKHADIFAFIASL